MPLALLPTTEAWRLELIVVRGASHNASERRSLSRDVANGLLRRLRQGVYVERTAFEALSPEDQHLVRMRALAAVTSGPVVFSHFSAAVALGLPVLRSRLGSVHRTVDSLAQRSGSGVSAHALPLVRAQVLELHDLLVTDRARTVVDIAGSAPLEEGVMAADAALRMGVPREQLEAAADLAGPRRSSSRIDDAVALAHPGADTAIESRGRVTMLRLGVEVPVLQQRFDLPDGSYALADFGFPRARAAAEADGDVKYLLPEFAPNGAGAVLLAEKHREDLLRAQLSGLARFGWRQSNSTGLLGPVLARAGIRPTRPRPTISDYAAAARAAETRFAPHRRTRAERPSG